MTERSKLISNLAGIRPGHSPVQVIQKKNDATEINLLHQSIIQDLSNVVQSAIIIGEKLSKQKEIVGHGKWLLWMQENLDFSDSTAKRYIRLFENRERLSNRSPMTDLKSALKLVSDSESEEKEINPPKTNPAEIYKQWQSGITISKNEKSALKVWLSAKAESHKRKASEIEKDVRKLK